jgi:hypothetical protein
VLAKALIAKKDRGDKTAIELFIASVHSWKETLWRFFLRELGNEPA